MSRFFNTAGPCDPDDHYMLPWGSRLTGVRQIIDRKHYFAVHAPRQSGKTTCFRSLADELQREGRYVALHASCETAATAGGDVERGVDAVISAIGRRAMMLGDDVQAPPAAKFRDVPPEERLAALLAEWSRRLSRPLVLFLDEIDALRDASLISVLRQLRSGYADRPEQFPQSVALIGLRDVRDYEVDASRLGTSSPFNIKVQSVTLADFTGKEIAELLAQHTGETGQAFDLAAVARIVALSRGQPWLVNALAARLTDELVPDHGVTITAGHVDQAKETLIERRDTHLDSLVTRLAEPRVQRILEPILAGEIIPTDVLDDDIQFVLDLGLVRSGERGLEIANPIYREVVPRALTSVLQQTITVPRAPYVASDGSLRVEKLLEDFAAFWREHAEFHLARQPYSEAAAQLIFMAFLQRIVNGGGFVDREYAAGSGRIDLCVRWPRGDTVDRFAFELKVWRDGRPDPLEKGLDQLTAYLERLDLDAGTLALFDARASAAPLPDRMAKETRDHAGRHVTVLRF